MTEIRDRRHSSWFWMDKAILDEYAPAIGAYGLAVYALLARYADNKGQAFPSLVTMSKALSMSKHSVIRTIEALCVAGLIEKSLRLSEHGDATSNVYTLLHVGGSASDAPPSAPQALPSASDALGVVPQMHHRSAPQALPIPLVTRLTEQELLEQEKGAASASKFSQAFEVFWNAYPNKVGKAPAYKAWEKMRLAALADTITADVTARLGACDTWQRGFIPNPATYLNQRRWEDEWQPPTPPPAPRKNRVVQ